MRFPDFEAAIGRLQIAISEGLDNALLHVLDHIVSLLERKYRQLGNLHDLETAIARSEAAVGATPVGHPDRAARLNTLGCLLSTRYDRLGNLQDLVAAIARTFAALEATPEDHPE